MQAVLRLSVKQVRSQTPNPKPRILKRDFFIDHLLVRIRFIIVMLRRTGLAPWEFEFPFPGDLTSRTLKSQPEALWQVVDIVLRNQGVLGSQTANRKLQTANCKPQD